MKKAKLVIFLVQGRPVEQIDGNDITIDETEKMKINIAIMHNVAYDDVEIDFKDIDALDISYTSAIGNSGDWTGKLIFRADNPYASWRIVEGVRPSFDITHDELFDEWLSLLSKGEISKAITFN